MDSLSDYEWSIMHHDDDYDNTRNCWEEATIGHFSDY